MDTTAEHNAPDFERYKNWLGVVSSSVMRKYNLCISKRDDYYSAARLGFVEAWKRFDSERGPTFEQYAYRRVKGAIIDAVRTDSHSWSSAAMNPGDTPITVQHAPWNLEHPPEAVSSESPEASLERKELCRLLQNALFLLPKEERELIIEHYFNEKPLSQIGSERGGQSRSWASRLHLKALKTLNKLCSEAGLLAHLASGNTFFRLQCEKRI